MNNKNAKQQAVQPIIINIKNEKSDFNNNLISLAPGTNWSELLSIARKE